MEIISTAIPMIFLFAGGSKKQETIALEEDTDVAIKNGIEAEVSGIGVLVLVEGHATSICSRCWLFAVI